MKTFLFAQRFEIKDYTIYSDMPWITDQMFIVEAENWREAFENLKSQNTGYKIDDYHCKEITTSDPFFQNTWVKGFFTINGYQNVTSIIG